MLCQMHIILEVILREKSSSYLANDTFNCRVRSSAQGRAAVGEEGRAGGRVNHMRGLQPELSYE